MSHAKTVLLWSAVLAVAFVCPSTGKPTKPSRLSKYLPNQCKMSDPQLNKCLIQNLNDILKFAKTGIPEFNIPILEPYFVQEIDLKAFQNLSVSLFGNSIQRTDKHKAFARNIVIHHSSEFMINNLQANFEKNEFFIDLTFPRLKIDAEYDVNIVLFNIPIKSSGPVYINATDSQVKASLNGKTLKRKNVTYLLFDSIDINVNFKDYSLAIERLFKKDQNLNRALNDMMRSQKTELRTLAMPVVEELAGKMVLETLNKILAGLPLEELFLPE